MVKELNDIYLDGSATTPVREAVLKRIKEVESSYWGNPSSLHVHGLKACEQLERSRRSIAISLEAEESEIVFTSGATESNKLSLIGSTTRLTPGRIVISSVEHPSVISAANSMMEKGWDVAYWPVDKFGRVLLSEIDRLLSYPTKIVSIVWAQSEVGTIQPIEQIGKICKEKGIIFHTDATQILSQHKFNWRKLPVDLLSFSAHKFQGPKGVGVLLRRKTITNNQNLKEFSSGQEYGIRAGTQPVALIAGMALAIELLDSPINHPNLTHTSEYQRILTLTNKLRLDLKKISYISFTGHPIHRLSNHISLLVGNSNNQPISGRRLVRILSDNGVSVSSGTACSSGNYSDSAVLKAMNIPSEWRQSGLRLSLGNWLSEEQILKVPRILNETILSLS